MSNIISPEEFDWDAFEGNGLYDNEDKPHSNVAENEVVEGVVTAINKRVVVVSIDGKCEGVISTTEFLYNPDLAVGNIVEVYVECAEDKKGQIVLSHKKARQLKSWAKVNEAYNNDDIVKGFVKTRTKGGLIVDVFGIEAFLPGSQLDVNYVTDFDQFVSQVYDFKIIKINPEFRNVVVSRKAVLESTVPDNNISKEDIYIGQKLTGRVRNIRDFGVFVDLGGFDGMVHRSNLSWKSFNDPREVVSVWDQVEVVVLGISGDKIELGMKQLSPNPWSTAEQDYPIGTVVTAKITNIEDYGIFAELPSGIVGLIHNNELQWGGKITKDDYSNGDSIEVEIININTQDKKLGLSRDKVVSAAFLRENPIGSIVPATVLQNRKSIIVEVKGIKSTIVDDDSLLKYSLKEGSQTKVSITGLTNRGISCSIRDYEKIIVDQAAAQIERGSVVEAEVIHILSDAVVIKSNDVCGLVPKRELSVNPVADIFKEVFIGEIINVVYLENSDGKLLFGKKYIENKDVYPDALYELGLDDILNQMSISHNCFIGYSNGSGYLNNLYVYYAGQERGDDYGNLLLDPITGRNIGIYAPNYFTDKEGFFVVNLRLSDKKYRREKHCPFIFAIDPNSSLEEKADPYATDVSLAYTTLTSPKANTALANLLEEVGQNMYSTKGRMFFELLQNADDASSANGVSMKVQSKGGYLIITHDGFAFSKNDFDSITSAAKSTKSSNKKKTGYKGIGFKSVFTNSEAVYIKTGGYSFAFDKSHPDYSDFEKFYYSVNNIHTEQEKIAFKLKFGKEFREFNMVDDIPWQLLPIQTQSFPKELAGGDFTSSRNNVAIALRMDQGKISEYQNDIQEVLSTPQFVLFLRNTKRIQMVKDGVITTISKSIANDKIQVKTSAQNDSKDIYYKLISGGAVGVNNTEFLNAAVPIEKIEIVNKRGENELIFVPIHSDGTKGERIPGIPNRIPSSELTEITFAIPIKADGQIEPIPAKANSFFAYLPMDESRFHLPFYVNADFILMSNREGVQCDNPWNYFLFYHIGRKIVNWVKLYASSEQPNYLKLLPRERFNEADSSLRTLSSYFNKGFLTSIENESFILGDDNVLHTQEEIILDDTGLSNVIGAGPFREMLGAKRHLPHTAIDSSPLKSDIFSKIVRVTFENMMSVLMKRTSTIKTELPKLDSKTLSNFYNWVLENQKNCQNLIPILPVLQFDGSWYSETEFKGLTNHIISNEKIKPIKGILHKIGFKCSENEIDSHPLCNYISVPAEKDVFELISKSNFITLSFAERNMLFTQLCSFTGIGESKVRDLVIFKNHDGILKPLKDMTKYSDAMPSWMHCYMLSKDETNYTTEKYSVSLDRVFSDILEPHLLDIISKTDIIDIYSYFKSSWKNSMTTSLINNPSVNQDSLLSIIEESDATTKLSLVKSLKSFDLISTNSYSAQSREYRIIRLAVNNATASTYLRSIIKVDGIPFSKITMKDEFAIIVNGDRYPFSMATILPNHTDSSKLSITDSFKSIAGYENVFAQNEPSPSWVKEELISYLAQSYCNAKYSALQFCFLMLFHKSIGGSTFDYTSRRYIDTSDTILFKSILDICFSMNVGDILRTFINDTNISYSFGKITGHYIDSDDYTLPGERVPSFIKEWADTEEKKTFLSSLGVHNESSDEITRRKSFRSNKLEDIWNISSTTTIHNFLAWVQNTESLPITEDNKVTILSDLFRKLGIQTVYCEEDFSSAIEWADEKYISWKVNKATRIYQYNGEMPYRGKLSNTVLYKGFNKNYVIFTSSNHIYINKNIEPEVVLADVYSARNTLFTKDDWRDLFLISRSRVSDLLSEVDKLRNEKNLLEEQLANSVTNEDATMQRGEDSSLSKRAMIDAQIEAQKALMRAYPDWEYPDGFGETNDDGQPYCYSCNIINTENGAEPIVLKSYKYQGSKFMVNPSEYLSLIRDKAQLFIYDGLDFKRIQVLDLLKDQTKVSISFSSKNLESDDRIEKLADALHYFNNITFNFDSFNISSQAESIRHIYRRKEGTQITTTDEDL